MKSVALLAGALLAVVLIAAFASGAVSRSAAAEADGQSHAITWDGYSLKIDGKRLVVWSGEMHPFRVPSPSLWRDILEKMKANGYNAVSIYVDWGYHSPKPGVYDFTGVRDLDRFFDIASELGIYVIARPGPYINAETDAGGFPAWLAATPGRARTNNATYMSYTDEWQSNVDPIIARHQLTNGSGTVILYEIENEYANNVTSTVGQEYMAHLYAKARADGITVPIFHNDKGRNGFWVPGDPGAPDLYAFDGYPGGTCSTSGNPGTPGTPPDWGYYGIGGRKGGASASPNTPGFAAEFGGGWFDPWGDATFGGAGYSCMTVREGPGYEREYYLTNIANGLKLQNIYMTFGGTSWGWLPAPVVYTSYDYGAAFNEARQQTAKVPAMKELGYFVQSVEPLAKVDPASPPLVAASNLSVKIYHLVNPDTSTHFYLVRPATSSVRGDLTFTFPLSTPDGDYPVVPQEGQLELKGLDMKALTANYDLDSQHLVYSTSEVMTHGAIGARDVALLVGRDGQLGETVLRYATRPTVSVLSGNVSVAWDSARGDLRLDYSHDGLARVAISGGGRARPLLLLLADDTTAATFWRRDTSAGPVLVRGPSLVRSAAVRGRALALAGDTAKASDLELWAPAAVKNVIWNSAPVDTVQAASGSLAASAQLSGPPELTLPALDGWKYAYETPEAQPGFDDSGWTVADRTSSNSITPIPAGQKDLFADDYGFHHGDVWYRGRYSGPATDVTLGYASGAVGMLEAWDDGVFLGSHQLPTPTAAQATSPPESATVTFAIPESLQTADDHTLSVLVRVMAHDEDGGANDAFKSARGLTAATLAGSGVTGPTWKIQGDQGGEDVADPVRGPLNNGGLFGERSGWYLPGYPDGDWTPVTLPYSDPTPGVAWYRTTFDLHEPQGIDASLGLTITDTPTKAYRALIFLNGWNLGQYVNNVGPQHTFALPNGILHAQGANTLAIAVTTNNANGGDTGGGLGAVELTNLGTVASSLHVENVDSPAYQP